MTWGLRLVLSVFFFCLVLFFISGLFDSPLSIFNRSEDMQIDPEYLNGVLAASSILFGFWAVVYQMRAPERNTDFFENGFHFKMFGYINSALLLLVISVVFIVLTAFNMFSSAHTLIFEAFSFSVNVLLLASTLFQLEVVRIIRHIAVKLEKMKEKKD